MRVFIIDTSHMAPELQGGLVGLEGSLNPTAAEKQECLEAVRTFEMDGWAIAVDPHTPIGWLAALSAEAACVPFVNLAAIVEPVPQAGQAGPRPISLRASVKCELVSTNFEFARQIGLGHTTCRYEGIGFWDGTTAHVAVRISWRLAALPGRAASAPGADLCRRVIEGAEPPSGRVCVGG